MRKLVKSKLFEKKIEKFAPRNESASDLISVRKKADAGNVKNNRSTKKLIPFVFVVLVIALLGTSYYFYHKYKAATSSEADDVVAKVSKLMELPENENATLATVTDKEKMKDQPFFLRSLNGDKVLIYTKAQRAILYRPSTNKIIEAMPLSMGKQEPAQSDASGQQTQSQPSQTQAAAESTAGTPLRVSVYNGSDIKGLAGILGDEIAKIDGVNVTEKINATGSFTKNLVVDISGNNPDAAQKIAATVNGSVGSLPDGETKPDADILVIGGSK